MNITSLNFLWNMVNLNDGCPFPGMPVGSPFCIATCVPEV